MSEDTRPTLLQVALPIPRLEPLTYSMPDGMSAKVGCRVLVPIGKRLAIGMVVGVDSNEPADVRSIKPIAETLDNEPVLPLSVITLAHRVSQYYVCSWGEALRAAMPADVPGSLVIRISLSKPVMDSDVLALRNRAPRRAALLQTLREHSGDVTVSYLQKKLKIASISEQLDALQRDGWIDIDYDLSSAGTRNQKAYSISDMLRQSDDLVRSTLDKLDKSAPKQSLLLSILLLEDRKGHSPILRSSLLQDQHSSASAINGLLDKGLITEHTVSTESVQRKRKASYSLSQTDEKLIELTAEQDNAVKEICSGNVFRVLALEGVTGSGKTIVYARAIEAVLERGKTAIVLVPEIALTPQLGDRFSDLFGESVAVFHSRLTPGEQARITRRIREGIVKIVLGARSAVWAPLENVGLIVVDEEHEQSYKQDDPAPRYHGRDVAIMRGALENCPVVLGSATLSLETRFNLINGKYTHVVLASRVDGATMPSIHILDISKARKASHMLGSFVDDALHAIQEKVNAHEGTIVFLNRRGFASQLQCYDCGDVPQCPNCDVSLTYHKATSSLKCHYCGHREIVRTACTVCGGTSMVDNGLGTQRLEEELKTHLVETPDERAAVIERMDADTSQGKTSHRSIIGRFAKGDVDVVVGTQMIAKGLDIPRVTLVIVANADQGIFQNDFRAAERTVQLLVQVAGRSGRTSAMPGSVYIQTSQPDHPAILAVQNNHLEEWSKKELTARREASYPPYTRFITIEIAGMDNDEVLDKARILSALIPEQTQHFQRLPVVTPSIAKIRNRYRQIIVIKNYKHTDPAGSHCRSLLRNALEIYYTQHASSGVQVTIDVDASGMI